MTENRLKKLKNKIFDLLETDTILVFIDYTLKNAGEINDNVIFINPKLGDRIITMIHECLHFLFPYKSEYFIEKESFIISKNLTVEEIKSLLDFIS